MTRPPVTGTAALEPRMVGAYLERIGHAPVRAPDTPTLASLQDAHVRTVPFENLDIHLGRPLSLELDALAEKIVERRRGGFCYELNGLFCALLGALGFEARLVEARVREDGGGLGARFEHARILVRTGEGTTLLVDVGTGVSPRGPIRLDEQPQRIGRTTYRVRSRGDRYDSEVRDGDTWEHEWSFDATPRTLDEFTGRCRYHEQSPESHFTRKPICTLVTGDGHVTLADRTLVVTRDGRRSEQEVGDPLAVLADRFGIALDRWPGS